jgi:hypothetical protein
MPFLILCEIDAFKEVLFLSVFILMGWFYLITQKSNGRNFTLHKSLFLISFIRLRYKKSKKSKFFFEK